MKKKTPPRKRKTALQLKLERSLLIAKAKRDEAKKQAEADTKIQEIIAKQPVFERCANVVLTLARETFSQRGGEYQDGFALPNIVTTFTDATLIAIGTHGVNEITREEKRLMQLAAVIDLKDARMIGPFKLDTVIDGINYRAVWAQLMHEYVGRAQETADTSSKP